MSSRIPTRYDTLRSDVNPFPPPYKRLRTDAPGYPTNVAQLTTNILQHEGVTTHDGGQSNEAVDITLYSRSSKADGLSAGQLVFMDTNKTDIDSVVCIHEVNRELAGILHDRWAPHIGRYTAGFLPALYPNLTKGAQMQYILDRFKFVGIMSSNDTPVGRLRGTKAVNVTVWGDSRIFDYWSHGSRKLRPFDSCYIVLRAVKISHDDKYQHIPNNVAYDYGESPERTVTASTNAPDEEKIVWQFIPYFNNKETITKEELGLSPAENRFPWFYWRLGKLHEFPTLPQSHLSDARTFRSTSKSAASVLAGSQGQTIQFKLNCQKK